MILLYEIRYARIRLENRDLLFVMSDLLLGLFQEDETPIRNIKSEEIN